MSATTERKSGPSRSEAFQVAVWIFIAVLCGIATGAVSGCTVVPKAVVAQQASYGDDGQQTSGFLGFVDGGGIIDRGALDRYNALIDVYGKEWLPAMKRDHGVTPRGSNYFISNDALERFIVMSDWRRMGRKPK